MAFLFAAFKNLWSEKTQALPLSQYFVFLDEKSVIMKPRILGQWLFSNIKKLESYQYTIYRVVLCSSLSKKKKDIT